MRFKLLKRSGGFTLIEFLVGMTIIGIMAGAGVANYRRLEQRKAVENAAKQVETAIRDTQKRATAGVKPELFCPDFDEYLVKYRIELGDGGLTNRQYRITAYCSDATTTSETLSLETGVKIQEGVTFDFDLLGQASETNAVCVSDVSESILFEVEVTTGGSVSFHFSPGSCSTT